ncbi:NACHT domain-containing protein [Nonomuraea jabiensis]|uniref:NACHT domain-containing protein n=1 Tax=Nonomuraea jabiensis TaxID=882448 RepID=UPI003D735FED
MATLAAATLAVNWTEKAHPLDLLAVVLPAAGFVAVLVTWARYPRASSHASASTTDVKAAAQILANAVERQWQEEARHRLVDDPHPMPVRWRFTTNQTLVSPRHLIAREGLAFDGRSDDVAVMARQFRALDRRRLVITGGPGTGKTTLAIQLLLHLLDTRTAGQNAAGHENPVPVPVLVPVSAWDTLAYPALQDWLVSRLEQDYPALRTPDLGAGAAAALVHGGYVLPVLDGLDEVGEYQRVTILTALNKSLGEHGQLVLTSRTAEFRAAVGQTGRPLTAAAVIAPRALTRQEAATYLSDCLPSSPSPAWRQVLDVLVQGQARGLADLTSTPLGLWLIRTVYLTPGADPSPLADRLGGDAAALRSHLLDRLIPTLIATRPPCSDAGGGYRPSRYWNPEAARRYLVCLARLFPAAETRDIAWWRIAHTIPRIRALLGIAVGLATMLVVLISGVLVFQSVSLTGIAFALEAGAFSGWSAAVLWPHEMPGRLVLHTRHRRGELLRSMKRYLMVGVVAAPVTGVVGGLAVWYVNTQHVVPGGIRAWLVGTVVFGLVMGLPLVVSLGLADWSERPTFMPFSTPRRAWQSDKGLTVHRALAVGLALGLPLGLGTVFRFGVAMGFATGLGVTLALAYTTALLQGEHHAWLACTLAVAWLAMHRKLPWKLMDFLDDAHRLGLLRTIGPIYQFRHASLHDHLARAQDA